jgi:hypothetical protein
MAVTIRVGERIPDTSFYIALRNQDDSSLTLFATPQEVISTLSPGYLSEGAADDRRAFAARRNLAIAFIASAHDQMDINVASMSEAERMALSARGARAVTEVETWSNRAPLYVLATLYTPYTDAPLPAGEEVWAIDPYTEAGLVASLADAGLLDAWPVHGGQTWDGGAR